MLSYTNYNIMKAKYIHTIRGSQDYYKHIFIKNNCH